MTLTQPIYVTQPFLPPLADFIPYLEGIWSRRVLTNSGPLHNQLEEELAEYLGVENVSLFSNGTIALLTALQVLDVSGEVITTPYSFVATSHSLLWNGLTPVFVDIESTSLNIDPEKIEAAITPKTSAILPVHCYGRPCNVEAIQRIADRYSLKVIYDAAHAFGVKYKDSSLLNHGDLSVLSFHATKVFNTFEGGAIICRDAEIKGRIDKLKNFGFVNEVEVVAPGINGKMNEFSAALGLLQLKHVEGAIEARKRIFDNYQRALSNVRGIRILEDLPNWTSNYSYLPILIGQDFAISRDELYSRLREANIYARRYFYPLISEFDMYRQFASASPRNLTVAHQAANEVLCLPIYPGLTEADQGNIIQEILRH